MTSRILAMQDMRWEIFFAVLLLVGGVVLLRWLSVRRSGQSSAFWLPIVALMIGPILGLGLCALDVFVISPENYLVVVSPGGESAESPYLEVLPKIMMICTFAGAVTALALAFGLSRLPNSSTGSA